MSGNRGADLIRVRADQRVPAREIDVVAHDHQRPGPERRIEAAGSVGQHHDPSAERLEQQHRLDDETRVVALVQVEATLQHHDGTPAEPAEEQTSDMTRGRRGRPSG
jgi:hypothetical protein